jgi:hypothetical protein
MLPAHDLQGGGGPWVMAPDAPNLAGVPSGSSMLAPYPTIQQDIDTYAPVPVAGFAANKNLHMQYDMNDLVLTDVVSFEVKVLWDYDAVNWPMLAPRRTYDIPTSATTSQTVMNADYPYDYLPLSPNNLVLRATGARVFDTWSQHGPYGLQQNVPNPNPPPAPAILPPTGLPNWRRTDGMGGQWQATATELPLRIRVRAILIRVRIYDAKAEQTRQITIYQDV